MSPQDATAAPAPAAPGGKQRCSMLLVEPNFTLRRTVALSARDMDLADVHEASSYEAAARMLGELSIDCMLLSLGDDAGGLALVRQVREGKTASDATLPIAVITGDLDKAGLSTLMELKVRRVLLKPVKVMQILDAAGVISGKRAAGPGVRLS